MRHALLILTAAFLSGGHADSTATAPEYKGCRSIHDFTLVELQSSRIPNYDKGFLKERIHQDGIWTYDLPLADVWNLYTRTPPRVVWRSERIRYRFATFPQSPDPVDRVAWTGLREGSRFYLDIVGPFCAIGMGVEVTQLVPQRMIKFDYLSFSPALGEQWVIFDSLSPKQTKVTHLTRYEGKDWGIELSYMYYHREAIAKLHVSVEALARRAAAKQ